MLDRLVRGSRVLACGGLLAAFAVVALAAGLFVVPWVRLTSSDEVQPAARVRRAMKRIFRGFVRLGGWLGVLRLRVEGASRLRGPGRIVVANHPTMLDALGLLSLLDDGVCVTRRKHWDRPVFRRVILEAGFPFDGDGVEVVDACVARIEEGASLLLFPEGTRSPARGLHPFTRGAAHIALRTGRDLLPVVVTCDPPAFRKDAPWYRVSHHPIELRIWVLDPISVDPVLRSEVPRPIAARQLTSALCEQLSKQLEHVRA
ncbi:MAG: lysophospholipid acyltransferase family protein [Myxococcota bacterium]|nr:lysophospholipid acyltransferase family protein [Myxococcota bacterium]